MSPSRPRIRLFVPVICAGVLAPTDFRPADLYVQGHLSVSAGVGDSGGAVQFALVSPSFALGWPWKSSPFAAGWGDFEGTGVPEKRPAILSDVP